jgi:hypothetical protein
MIEASAQDVKNMIGDHTLGKPAPALITAH